MVKLREIYISKQSNESEISPIKPTSVTRIQAWILRVFPDNDYVQVKSSKSRADVKLNYTDKNYIKNLKSKYFDLNNKVERPSSVPK